LASSRDHAGFARIALLRATNGPGYCCDAPNQTTFPSPWCGFLLIALENAAGSINHVLIRAKRDILMAQSPFNGRAILVVEEDPLIAIQLEGQFQRVGAKVYAAGNLRDALHMAHHPALAAAVVNLRLGGDDTAAVCRRLSHLGIPFMIHTRFDPSEASQRWPSAPVVSKPANSRMVLRTVAALLH
jgi:CheY-like chemotaxis protein